jgi:hypothetical protein
MALQKSPIPRPLATVADGSTPTADKLAQLKARQPHTLGLVAFEAQPQAWI